ncbi:MAG TPA: FtsX-like permease family protein [Gemmatimonadales bacterium]|nr:FtsX-like permease family protein [Gemmatimonadales bacterium]
MTLSALDRKLFRDLWAMKGQAIAIALLAAAGVAMYVMYQSNFTSLSHTQHAYYERQRFAHVFATLKRAPQRVAVEIAAIPGVSAVEARVASYVTLDLGRRDEPAGAQLIAIPTGRRPRVNDLFLRRGRWIEAGRSDEILASEGFVLANRLEPGDQVSAIINGRLRPLTIVGVALSPEYVYSIRPGELIPDDERFGVFWMDEKALATAFDMEGGFNDLVLSLSPGASTDEVIGRLDRILEPFGGRGAIPRASQPSHWTVENELLQLKTFGFVLPLIFLIIASFVLNLVLTRALELQRTQIALLKALGYDNTSIGWHYLKWAMVIGAIGVVIGVIGGVVLGTTIIGFYNEYFRFPVLAFHLPLRVVVGAAALTFAAAGAGAFRAVVRAVKVPPAEAMRPEAPARYRRTILETPVVSRHLGMAGRMVVRNIARHRFRAAATVFGISCAVAILMVGFVFTDAIERLILTQFWHTELQDVTVNFMEPRGDEARHMLARLPGVVAVEPQRSVPVRVRAAHRQRYLALTGVSPSARLKRVLDRRGAPIRMPPAGVVLSLKLAEALGVTTGDVVTLDVLEGRRPTQRVEVAGLVDDLLGLAVYMDIVTLHQLMREGDVATSALLLIDPSHESRLSSALKGIPTVAGAGFKRAVLKRFREILTATLNLSIFINLLFAGVIAFGVVYNAARISLSERTHELASLRVLGFTRAEISLILLDELALLTLVSLPLGGALGYSLAVAIVESIDSEVYRFPLYVSRQAVAQAFLGIIGAALVSGLVVRRKLDHLDLIAVLKAKE